MTYVLAPGHLLHTTYVNESHPIHKYCKAQQILENTDSSDDGVTKVVQTKQITALQTIPKPIQKNTKGRPICVF